MSSAAVAHNDEWLPWLTAEIGDARPEGDAERRQLRADPFSRRRRARDAAAADAFLKSRGIILRRVDGLRPARTRLRMTIGTEDDNRAVVAALAEFLQQAG